MLALGGRALRTTVRAGLLVVVAFGVGEAV